MGFKIGDKIKCNLNVIPIWVKPGKIYEVFGTETTPAEPFPRPCYRNCGHPMHNAKPERHFVIIDGELGKRATIFEGCFKLKKRKEK